MSKIIALYRALIADQRAQTAILVRIRVVVLKLSMYLKKSYRFEGFLHSYVDLDG